MYLRKTSNLIKSLKNIPNEDDIKKPRKEPKPSLRQMFFDIPKSKNKIKNKSKNTKNNTKK